MDKEFEAYIETVYEGKTLKDYIKTIYEAEQGMYYSGILNDVIEIRKDLSIVLQDVHTYIGQLVPMDKSYVKDISNAKLLINLINFLLDGNDIRTTNILMQKLGYMNRRLLLKNLNSAINKKPNKDKNIFELLYEIKKDK